MEQSQGRGYLTVDDQKRAAAEAAVALVEPGMAVGLGSGSTAEHFVQALAHRVREGLTLKLCVATSVRTAKLAEAEGLRVGDLNDVQALDLTVDGADEIDGDLNLIKGGGGAHVREKIVAAASRRFVVIADASKYVETLGAFPLPVEVLTFGWRVTHDLIAAALAKGGCGANFVKLRGGPGRPFTSDQGNYILDCAAERIPDPERLAAAVSIIPGVVGHGLFIGMAERAIIATQDRVFVVAAQNRNAQYSHP